jgi:uncharacterized RDD family membrane protein YckC
MGETATMETLSKSAVRPWVRFWARFFDEMLCWVITLFLFTMIWLLGVQPRITWYVLLIQLMSWSLVFIFSEAYFLAKCGSTPGKWLLKTRVVDHKGELLSYNTALIRSFNVWLRGIAAGVQFIAFFTMERAYQRLKKDGITSWDKSGHFLVLHSKIGIGRIGLYIFLSITFCCLIDLMVNTFKPS